MGELARAAPWSSYRLHGRDIDPAWLRQPRPGEPSLTSLISPGDTITTSYGTGPYVVEHIVEGAIAEVRCWSLVCRCLQGGSSTYLNEYTTQGSEIVSIWTARPDRVRVIGRSPRQLSLFKEARRDAA